MTHFWDPDGGDSSSYEFLGSYYDNAYYKASQLWKGDFYLFIPASNPETYNGCLVVTKPNGEELLIYPDVPQYGGFYYTYADLIYFYNKNKVNTALLGKNQMYNITLDRYEYWNGEVILQKELCDRIVWELLGRICHLLTDMTVPAHTHNDPHPADILGIPADPDAYEVYMTSSNNFAQWNYQDAINQGSFIDPSIYNNPLKYLFYTTSQITSFFPSDDVGGNNVKEVNDDFSLYPGLTQFMNNLYTEFGSPPPTPTNSIVGPIEYFAPISNNCFVYGIRMVAGFLYWFAKDTDLLPGPLQGVDVVGDYTLFAESPGIGMLTGIMGLLLSPTTGK